METFENMKLNLITFAKENAEKFDLTTKQLMVLSYILKGKNFLKTKSQIAQETGVSRPTVGTLFSILESLYDDFEKEVEINACREKV